MRAPVLPSLLILLVVSGVAVAGPTYRWVDDQGVVHYSDTPQPGAEKIQIQPAATFHSTPTAAGTSTQAGAAAKSPYQSCEIAQPESDAALYAPETVTVSVAVTPTIRAGDQLEVLMDGTQLQSSGAGSFVAQQPERGTHTLTAVVRDASGKMLCSSSAVHFSVQRPSALNPGSPVRPH